MGDGIQINRLGERFSSHTQSNSRPRVCRTTEDIDGLRQRLIAATVEVVAEGGSPRLVKSRVRPYPHQDGDFGGASHKRPTSSRRPVASALAARLVEPARRARQRPDLACLRRGGVRSSWSEPAVSGPAPGSRDRSSSRWTGTLRGARMPRRTFPPSSRGP